MEVGDFVEDTVKALLANNPAPDQNTQPLEHVGHMNALKAQAEELAEPLMFGGCQRGELGFPKWPGLSQPVDGPKTDFSMAHRRIGKRWTVMQTALLTTSSP